MLIESLLASSFIFKYMGVLVQTDNMSNLQGFLRRESFIPFSPPQITDEEVEAVVQTLRSPWLTTGPQTKHLEEEFCQAYGAPAALALNSCTAGMHVALITHGIGAGDEVIVPTHTFCATANVVEHVGARPVLVDIQDDTLNIDPDAIRAAITPKTKAILPVHYAGHPVDLDEVFAIAEEHNLTVIEDAAHPVSATYREKFIGSRDNLAAFSFYATKNMTTGEGGILTGSRELIDRARVISLHGMDKDAYKRYEKGGSWRYDVILPGFKYNMPDILASVGRVQLRRLNEMQAKRIKLVGIYNERLAGIPGLRLPVQRPDVTSSWHLYVLRVDPEVIGMDRDAFANALVERNVGVSVHYTPVHMHSYYQNKYGYTPESFPVAYRNFQQILSLPLSPAHSEEQIIYVTEAIKDVLASKNH